MLSKEIRDSEIIDAHTHASGIDMYNFFLPRAPSTQSVAELGEKMVASGVSCAVVFPMPFSFYYSPREVLRTGELRPSGLEDFPYEKENQALMYEVGFVPGYFLPFLAIDPGEEVEKQIAFLKNNKNYYGLKFHPVATHSSLQDLEGSLFLDILQERNLPLMVHSGVQKNALPKSIFAFAKEHPELKVCLAHLAGFDAPIIEAARELDNLFFDVSPFLNCCYLSQRKDPRYFSPQGFDLNYGDPLGVLIKVNKLLKGHLIWGTDEPWTTLTDPQTGETIVKDSYGKERRLLEQLDESGYPDVKFEITNQNIRRFLWG